MKKQSGFRRLTALALALCMLAALTAEIFAADIVASGYCGGEGDGTNLSWTLDSEVSRLKAQPNASISLTESSQRVCLADLECVDEDH